MKKIIIALIFTLFSSLAFSQWHVNTARTSSAYFPLLNNSAWLSREWVLDSWLNLWHYTTGDTLIDGKTYLKVYQSLAHIQSLDAADSTEIYQNAYFGAVREDVTNKKVYFVRNTTMEEELLYDFNLVEGAAMPFDDSFTLLSSDDSISTTLGYTQLYDFENAEEHQANWAIGIGSLASPFYPSINNVSGYLLCFYQNDELVYSNPDYGFDCTEWKEYIGTDIAANISSGNSIEVYPIPSAESITISVSTANLTNLTYQIYTINGEKITEQKITEQKTNISFPVKGIYILKIANQFGVIENKKIIIQ